MTTEADILTHITISAVDMRDAIGAELSSDKLIITMIDGAQFRITADVI